MEKFTTSRENPIELSSQEKLEVTKDRSELISGLIEEYSDMGIDAAIRHYIQTNSIQYKVEKVSGELEKRKAQTNLLIILQKYRTHLEAIYDLQEMALGGRGLNTLMTQIDFATTKISEAPDITYGKNNLPDMYDGHNNVPLGTSNYEETVESLHTIATTINGLVVARDILNPRKV